MVQFERLKGIALRLARGHLLVGKLKDALVEAEMYDNTLFVFT